MTNQSYGSGPGVDSTYLSYDANYAAYGVLAVAAAGNSGPASSTVEAPCVGYDAVCVGSYEMGSNLSDPSDDAISSWSARGPGPLGVKKPDLVAVGDTAFAEEYYVAKNSLWAGGTGTSFAAPLVAGAATLLAGSGITDHLAEKAILIDSARPGRKTSTDAMGTQTDWQPDWGWGELDLQAALAQRTNFVTGSLPGGSARFYKVTTQSAGERATLTWDMRVTGFCTASDCGSPSSVYHTLTNLDLIERDATNPSAVQASSTSAVDSVEQVRSPSQPGQVIYVVKATSSVDGATAEPFALAAKSPLTEVKAPEPTLTAALSTSRAHQGEAVTVTAHLTNPSADLAGQNAEATLVLPPGVQLISGSATEPLGTLAKKGQPGDAATVSWTVQGTSDGLGDLRVVATTQAYGEQLRSESDAGRLLVDSTPPSVSLTTADGPGTTEYVSWAGSDSGSGLDHYDTEVQTDDGPWLPLAEPTTQTSADFAGSYGHRYAWRARAIDALGNASEWATSQTRTMVDPTASPGGDATCVCGTGSSPSSTTTTWTPTGTSGGTRITTPTTRANAGLRITYARASRGTLVIRGRLRGHGRVTATARFGARSLRAVTVARASRFALRLRLPRDSAPPRRIAVLVRFAGDARHAPAGKRVTARP